MRIEGNQEIVELTPGSWSADPDLDAGRGFGPGYDLDHEGEAAAGRPPSRLAEWWASGRPAEWLAGVRDRILGSRPVRPVADAVTTAVARVPQRSRVVLVLLAIAAAGFVALGVASSLVLRGYVTDRADAQLQETSADLGAVPSLMPSPGFLRGADPERRAFFYFTRQLPTGVAAQLRTSDGDFFREFGETSWTGPEGPRLPADLAARGGHPFTVPARATAGRWRVLVTAPTQGTTLIVATNVTSSDAVAGRLSETALVAGGLAVAVMGFVGFRIVRSGATRLTEIERTVEAAVAGDLSQRVPVQEAGTGIGAGTAPDQVAHAVNALIEQVGDARAAEERALRRVGEADRAVRLPLSVIQGFAAYYRDVPDGRAEHDSVRMSRLVDRVSDEATRIGVVLQDLMADLSGARHQNGTANGTGTTHGNGASHGNGLAAGNGAMHDYGEEDRK